MPNSQHVEDIAFDPEDENMPWLPDLSTGNPISGMPEVIMEMAVDLLDAEPIWLIYQIGNRLLDKSSIPSCDLVTKPAGRGFEDFGDFTSSRSREAKASQTHPPSASRSRASKKS